MVIREVRKKDLQAEPYLVWNAFIDILAMSNYEDISDIQRPAHLVFWYESEVQNGGHFQYFENNFQVNYRIPETIISLKILGAGCQSKTLEKAYMAFKTKERKTLRPAPEFCEIALMQVFEECDNEFGEAKPELTEILEKYLKENEKNFVKIID